MKYRYVSADSHLEIDSRHWAGRVPLRFRHQAPQLVLRVADPGWNRWIVQQIADNRVRAKRFGKVTEVMPPPNLMELQTASYDRFLQEFDFEGYLVYRSTEAEFNDIKIITDSKGSPKYWKPIAQFDLVDGISGPDPIGVNGAHFWRGDDTGLQHAFIDTTVTNGVQYYYAVVAYDRGDPNRGTKGLTPAENTKIIREDFSGNVLFTDINFIGNEEFSDRALRDAIASGPRGTFRPSGPFAIWLHAPELGLLAQALEARTAALAEENAALDAGDRQADDRAGLIWPAVSGWGVLTANVHWESGNYSELRDRFVRDPLGLSTGYDSTATDHRPPSPGMQCFTKQHQMFVHPDVPLSFLVAHNASSPRKITHAQFKLAIHPTQEGA